MGGIPGIVGAIGGLLACIASSILICCAPKKAEEGPCKFTAAGVMLLIAGILQLIMAVVVVVFLIMAVTAVNENEHCSKRYSSCLVDSSGCSCKDGTSGWPIKVDGTDDYSGSYCSSSTDGLCHDNSVDNPEDATSRCATESEHDLCKSLHASGTAVVTGIIVIFFGLSAGFLLLAGILNTIGGAYCIKAKAAIEKAARDSAPAKV